MNKYKLARPIVSLFYKKGWEKTFLLEDLLDEENVEFISKQMNRVW